MLLIGAVAVAAFGLGRDTIDGWQWATILDRVLHQRRDQRILRGFARGFPAYARATGTGFVLGVGRLVRPAARSSPARCSAALGNDQLLTVSAIMAMGSVVFAGAVPDAAGTRWRRPWRGTPRPKRRPSRGRPRPLSWAGERGCADAPLGASRIVCTLNYFEDRP